MRLYRHSLARKANSVKDTAQRTYTDFNGFMNEFYRLKRQQLGQH